MVGRATAVGLTEVSESPLAPGGRPVRTTRPEFLTAVEGEPRLLGAAFYRADLEPILAFARPLVGGVRLS